MPVDLDLSFQQVQTWQSPVGSDNVHKTWDVKAVPQGWEIRGAAGEWVKCVRVGSSVIRQLGLITELMYDVSWCILHTKLDEWNYRLRLNKITSYDFLLLYSLVFWNKSPPGFIFSPLAIQDGATKMSRVQSQNRHPETNGWHHVLYSLG